VEHVCLQSLNPHSTAVRGTFIVPLHFCCPGVIKQSSVQARLMTRGHVMTAALKRTKQVNKKTVRGEYVPELQRMLPLVTTVSCPLPTSLWL